MLSTSYRCPKKLVDMASKIAPNIKAADWAIDGEFNIGVNLDNVQPGDMILCRNSAPLIKLHRRLTKAGKPSYIKNVELGETFEDIIELTKCETIECLLESLEKHIVDVWETIAKALNCELKECVSEQRIVNLFDVYKIIEEMSESVENVSELSDYLKSALSATDKENAISLSTIHRAKGLEADNVYVICPSIIPSPLAKKDWEKEAEKYLEYVMLTRAKKSLNMVDESVIRAGQWVSNEAIMYSELKKIKDKIETAG
jgi:superfamily I DNA/RNA helicase